MTTTYRFDDFEFHPATRELRKAGRPLALPARAFDCLAYLIEHRERAVGRDELIAAVWGRVEISDALLGHTIVRIRRSLGDTGNEQRTIRTVPRFGYRWALPLEAVAEDAAAAADAATDAAAGAPVIDVAAIEPALDADASSSPRRSHFALAAIAGVTLALGVLGYATWRQLQRATPVASSKPVVPAVANADDTNADAPIAVAALVLPAAVDAPDEWRWLRLGVMDLVANRLRSGALPTAPSESVVSLLRQHGNADAADLLHDATLAQAAAMRVLPRVSLADGRWRVRLEAFGTQRSLTAEADGGDAISAARDAADALLRKLGKQPRAVSASDAPPALEALLQRSGAAMLADQLDQARALIEAAPPELRERPQVEHRMAQIELRSGEYDAAEARMHALVDRLPPGRDDALRARAMLTLAAAQVRRNHAELAADLYDEAIALRANAGDHEVLGVARLGRGTVLAQQGRYDEATAELSQARTELATIGDSLGVASVDVNLGEFQRMRHRPADALAVLKGAARQFERLGAREGRAYALVQQALVESELLDVDAAFATSERFWPAEANTNNRRMRWQLTRVRAVALVGVGRVADAQALLAQIDKDADAQRDAPTRAQAALLAARIAERTGDAAAATASIARARVPALRDADPSDWTRALVLHARIQREHGDLAAAAATTVALQAEAAGDEWRKLQASLAAAEQAWAERRREPALERFAQAMQAAERFGVPDDLVAVGAPYLAALVDASQLDSARTVSGRIALWAEHDARAAGAQARLFRALGQDDAARVAEENEARLLAGYTGLAADRSR
ncbi:DNA-binding winged helix-turn-helix (wHTH) protein/tetratricopeptide (TPR) repeat protein [Dokdonella fugitiva]|uniref:DNA-binding winged helix-turn-helix (WHTH) protein/tetratricopeptide (TPR) repeat protein n=1 Tax=Dokdonella fugitiva TaxID=328517 RepID=A0A839F988_9GAMM|nr:transcriptional regulator [Dokdonella fugitiva]MBA8888714.1 DNA-binding winged helix-turn-helix (wHTH) protein/tetratricopeptide (TPR) repeat protein [Dokdonella fugitiva]